MRIVYSTDDPPTGKTEGLHVYNALDCCITLEVLEAILPQLDEVTSKTYEFARVLQAPILEMECRGVRVDRERISSVRERLQRDLAQIQEGFDEICTLGLGLPEPVNANSPKQMEELFYGILQIKPIKKRKPNGSYGPSTDRKSLEKLRANFWAEPLVNHILSIRDIRKKLGVLATGIDADGRIRTSYNIAGTDTGRLSSYESSFGSGTNLQNITAELREIFIADPGKKLAYIDLEQAESRAVGAILWNLFDSPTYLDFCESGDLHTNVAKMTFTHLPWTDDPKLNKSIASGLFYREDSYRQACKKLGHGSNYRGKPPHMANETRIPVELVEGFQRNYFSAFPAIPEWHRWVAAKLQRDGWLTSFMGRRRHFFGRRHDDETVRAAIAYDPQGGVADIVNRGLFAVWQSDLCELLLQVHDAVVIQYDEAKEDEVVPAVQKLLEVEVPLARGRSMRIPTEAQVGWNWAYKGGNNPDGLVKYTGHDDRRRTPPRSFLDRKFY